ncbi:hypothetical protein Tco_1014271 [Tanacetum coccineum]
MGESAKRHKENSNLIKEIRASMDAAIRNQGASIKTLEIQIGQISKVLQEKGFGSLPSSTETNPRDHVKLISTIVETEKKESYGPQFSEAYSKASHINNSIPRKEKDPGSFTLPCFINNVCFDNVLADLGAGVSVMPLSTYLNLGLGGLAHTKLTVELADRTVKYPKGITKNVLVGIGKFIFPIDFIILDMPEDIKVPLILGRPFLSTARAKIDVYKRKITLRVGEERIIFTSVKPTSSLIKSSHLNKMVYKGNNVIGALMNVPIFVGTFSVVADFTVLENMDAYRNDGMGDVIFGKPFLREVGIKTRRFEGMITIYNGDDEVTYQMERSHLRFKHTLTRQCIQISTITERVSEKIRRMESRIHTKSLRGSTKEY